MTRSSGAGAYPLTWPEGMPRAKTREVGAFKTSLAGALENVKTSLRLFGQDSRLPVTNVVLSSNVTLGLNAPEDPGVAVWFEWDGASVCIPVDRYKTPAANLQAIHHVLEARRVELRHGTLALVRASFHGLKALPAPGPHWADVLGVSPQAKWAEIDAAFKAKAKALHPDVGGSEAAMAELNAAHDQAWRDCLNP